MNRFDDSIHQLAEMINSGKIDPFSLIDSAYEAIDKWQSQVNALITAVPYSDAMKRLKSLGSKKLPLKGIPFALKDSYLAKYYPTTAGSNVLKNFVSPYNATVYQKLIDAGAILVGKANMDAWGHGASTENTDFGPTRNPYNLDLVVGGSSGGCAAAVATGMCAFAIGEDTGGSIRNPAAWNNLTGLKVTYGRVSRYGCIAYASSLDTVGPMTKTAQDAAYILEVIAGHDPLDATSSNKDVPKYNQLSNHPKPMKIGIPKQALHESLDLEIKEALNLSLKALKSLGHAVVKIDMPMLEHGLAVYYLIGPSETSSNLARYDGIRFGDDRNQFTSETMRRLMTGTFALSSGYYDAYYKKAQQGRTLLVQEYNSAFNKVDAILMPVNPTMPPKLGELVSDPIANMLADMYTITQNIVGVPSLAFPVGFNKSNLPIGMQICGPNFSESKILSLVHSYQKQTDWHKKEPKLND